jgi:ornithine cyclodeaminase/alanine dehydrogenase-like protein (mu-crystallin family)
MPDLIDAMERALAAYSSGVVAQPVRTVVDVGPDKNFFGVMPAYVGGNGEALGAKLVTFFVTNTQRGIPTHFATIVLLDPQTGQLEAILDGRYLTEARTAAVSAVSARWLARPDSKRLAIIGSGVQAHSHFEALSHVFEFERVTAWSPTRAKLDEFCASTGAAAAESIEQAVADADIVATVSAARQPIVMDASIRPGTHVIAVGACRPNHRELDGKLVARARLIVDSRAGALREAGDILLPIAEGLFDAKHIEAELGEHPVRHGSEEVTVFKSLGMAVEDVVAGKLVYDRARAANAGVEFEF